MNNFECEQFLELTLSLGRQYVETGAEIKRVEDSLYRIYNAYGFENIEIYAITSLIVVTIKGPDGTHYTQSVRVTSGGTDLGRLEDINALIRYICSNKPNLVKLSEIINNPKKTKPKKLLKCIGYMLAAGGFAVFFGGDMLDGTAAAVIAIAVYFMDYNFKLRNINNVIYTFIASLVSGVIALIFTYFGFGNNVDKVMIERQIQLYILHIGSNPIEATHHGIRISYRIRFHKQGSHQASGTNILLFKFPEPTSP